MKKFVLACFFLVTACAHNQQSAKSRNPASLAQNEISLELLINMNSLNITLSEQGKAIATYPVLYGPGGPDGKVTDTCKVSPPAPGKYLVWRSEKSFDSNRWAGLKYQNVIQSYRGELTLRQFSEGTDTTNIKNHGYGPIPTNTCGDIVMTPEVAEYVFEKVQRVRPENVLLKVVQIPIRREKIENIKK